MRDVALILALSALALTGCQKAGEVAADAGKPAVRGRYVGVGIYRAETMWGQLARARPEQADPAAATLVDDDHVIVVLDTATGELRQCGNMSGHCLASKPWAKTTSAQPAPARVLKHLEDLMREDRAASEAAEPAARPPQK